MKSFVNFFIDRELYEKFQKKLATEYLSADEVIEKLIRNYIEPKAAFEKRSDFYAKANKGIPLWAMKANQNNHKVIRAYFKALQRAGEPVSLNEMIYYCTNTDHQDTYISPTAQNSSEKRFWNTYNQLKVDSPNSNGKVFEDHDYLDSNGRSLKVVTVWNPVKNTLKEFKKFFGG